MEQYVKLGVSSVKEYNITNEKILESKDIFETNIVLLVIKLGK